MRNVNWLGLIICGVCTVVSLVISILYGATLSDSAVVGLVYSTIGVASVLWEATALHRYDHLRREGRPAAASACLFGLAISTIVTMQYEVGFISTLFEGKASVGMANAGNRETLEAERAGLRGQIAKAGVVRPVEAIEGDVAAKIAIRGHADEIRARATTIEAAARAAKADAETEAARKGCGDLCKSHLKREADLKAQADAIIRESAAAMAGLDVDPSPAKLAAELGAAKAVATAQARIREIANELKPLAGSSVGDTRALYVAKASRALGGEMSEETARFTIAAIIILFLLAGRVFGPYVFMDSKASGARPLDRAAPPAVEKKPIPAAEWREVPLPVLAAVEVEPARVWDEPDDGADDMSVEEIDAIWELEQAEAERAIAEAIPAGDVPPVPAAAPLEQLTPEARKIRGIVQQFADACLTYRIGEPQYKEAAQTMQDCFQLWMASERIVDKVHKMDFGRHMTAILERMGGKRDKSGSWYYYGCALRPKWADRLDANGRVVPEKEQQTAGRRLGAVLTDRRPQLTLEAEGETAGNA